jgi:hypothetical protein
MATSLTVGSMPAAELELRVDELGAVRWMGLATESGLLEIFSDVRERWAGYELSLRETGERYRLTLTDGGDGSWHVTTDFGASGAVSFTYEPDGRLIPGPSSIGDCDAVTGSSLYAALQSGLAAIAGNVGSSRQAHLQQAASTLGIVAASIGLGEDSDCAPATPNIFWNVCFYYPTYEECSHCCDAATEAAATAMALPCAAAGPVPAGGCLVAVAAALYSCRATCYVYLPGPPEAGEGEACGGLLTDGTCFELCPVGTHDGGILGCDPPLTCCVDGA